MVWGRGESIGLRGGLRTSRPNRPRPSERGYRDFPISGAVHRMDRGWLPRKGSNLE